MIEICSNSLYRQAHFGYWPFCFYQAPAACDLGSGCRFQRAQIDGRFSVSWQNARRSNCAQQVVLNTPLLRNRAVLEKRCIPPVLWSAAAAGSEAQRNLGRPHRAARLIPGYAIARRRTRVNALMLHRATSAVAATSCEARCDSAGEKKFGGRPHR